MQDQREVLDLCVVHIIRLGKETVCFPNKDYKICNKRRRKCGSLTSFARIDIILLDIELYELRKAYHGEMQPHINAKVE